MSTVYPSSSTSSSSYCFPIGIGSTFQINDHLVQSVTSSKLFCTMNIGFIVSIHNSFYCPGVFLPSTFMWQAKIWQCQVLLAKLVCANEVTIPAHQPSTWQWCWRNQAVILYNVPDMWQNTLICIITALQFWRQPNTRCCTGQLGSPLCAIL